MVRNDDRFEDKPPFSKLFIVCSKNLTKEDLEPVFSRYGDIEKINLLIDRSTGQSRGVAYVKYAKTSSAAAAIQALHMTVLENTNKPIKVMVSSSVKSEDHDFNDAKYRRLFIKVPKEMTEDDLLQYFSKFGSVSSVYLMTDKIKQEGHKGFGYVHYETFLGAATALEECDKKYKAIFATPKEELKRSRLSNDNMEVSSHSSYPHHWKDTYSDLTKDEIHKRDILPLIKTKPQNYDTVQVTCSPCVLQRHLERLFRVIPGMISFKFNVDVSIDSCKATIKYNTNVAAAYAVESLNNFEFPSGETVTVIPDDPISQVAENLTEMVNTFKNSFDNPNLLQLADAIQQASSIIKAATSGRQSQKDNNICSVNLPPRQPLADKNSAVAQRCFLVFTPGPPPLLILRDIFSRFGDLIEVSIHPKKTFGFAKYASTRAAQEAITTLHGATVLNTKLKVIEAVERDTDQNETKRPKLMDTDE